MIQTIVVGSQFVKISINPQNHSGQLDQVNRDNSTRGRRSSHGDEIWTGTVVALWRYQKGDYSSE